MFGCRENERKRRENREKCDLKMKSCACTERLKVRVTKVVGELIYPTPMCEMTKMPKI